MSATLLFSELLSYKDKVQDIASLFSNRDIHLPKKASAKK
jgi:hypothetical protein